MFTHFFAISLTFSIIYPVVQLHFLSVWKLLITRFVKSAIPPKTGYFMSEEFPQEGIENDWVFKFLSPRFQAHGIFQLGQ